MFERPLGGDLRREDFYAGFLNPNHPEERETPSRQLGVSSSDL